MRAISDRLLTEIVKRGSNDLKILDAGCGTGGMMLFLQKYGEVHGVDASDEAIKFCRERKLNFVKKGSVENLPFSDKTFDLVTSFDVLYHQWVNNDRLALAEFARVLKPGGHLLIRVPAYNWLRGSHDLTVGTKHRYTRPELVEKVQTTGLIIQRATYANTLLFPLAVVKRVQEKLMGARENSDIGAVNPLLNNLLKNVLLVEAAGLERIDFPFGLSLFLLAQKPD